MARSQDQASDQLAVTCVARRPRAIVIILGWMGAQVGQIHQIEKIYHNLNCSTIAATAPALSLAVNDTTTLGELAITACREAARLIRMAEMSEMGFGQVPILLHVLGGGANILEELERRIFEVLSPDDLDLNAIQDQATPARKMLYSSSRSMRKLTTSSRSLISTASTSPESDDESDNEGASPAGIWSPPSSDERQLVQQDSPSLSLSRLSLGRCKETPTVTPPKTTPKPRRRRRRRKKRTPPVKRIDMERNGLINLPTCHPCYNPEDRAYCRDIQLVAARLMVGCILFDAAPCYPTLQAELAAAEAGIDNVASRMMVQSAIASAHGLHGIVQLSLLGKYSLNHEDNQNSVDPVKNLGTSVPAASSRAEQFWYNLQHVSLSSRHAFVYSPMDPICDVAKLRELISQQERNGIKVMQQELSHCRGHLNDKRYLRDDYLSFVEDVLDSVAECKLGEENEEDWWSSEDEEAGQEVLERGEIVV